MTSGTVSSLFLLLLSCTPAALAQQAAQFNQVLNINGDMDLNSFVFPDRSKIETFSQKQQQLIVNQNTPPIPPNQVTGSTGQPFVAMMSQSMSISTNNASDLVGGQIELAMDPAMLQQNAVNPDNTFVAMLSPDRQTWMIQETIRSVNISDMTVRMLKRNNIDGEYIALGRQTVETNAFLTTFGSDSASQVAIQGSGLQENEFQDGFRMSIKATQPLTMNVDVKDGVEQGMLAGLQGQQSVNDFRYSVTTNLAGVVPDLNQQVTVVQIPLNTVRIQQMMQAMGVAADGQVALAVAQRGVLQNPGGATAPLQGVGAAPPAQRRSLGGRSFFRRQVQAGTAQPQAGTPQTGGTPTTGNNPVAAQLLLAPTFTPVQANAVFDRQNMRIAIPVRAVDGEFIITMSQGGAAPQPQAAQPAPAQQQQPEAATPPTPEASAAPAQNGTAAETPKPAEAEAAKPAEGEAKPAEGEAKPERRQAADQAPPTGGVFVTMKEVNQMVDSVQWGGQAPISQMMTDYVKSQTEKEGKR